MEFPCPVIKLFRNTGELPTACLLPEQLYWSKIKTLLRTNKAEHAQPSISSSNYCNDRNMRIQTLLHKLLFEIRRWRPLLEAAQVYNNFLLWQSIIPFRRNGVKCTNNRFHGNESLLSKSLHSFCVQRHTREFRLERRARAHESNPFSFSW
jgi:hypothetical protein